MTAPHHDAEVRKLPTAIEGIDLIANGGLPKGRSTLVSGTSGSACGGPAYPGWHRRLAYLSAVMMSSPRDLAQSVNVNEGDHHASP